jgi:hypothetical protein
MGKSDDPLSIKLEHMEGTECVSNKGQHTDLLIPMLIDVAQLQLAVIFCDYDRAWALVRYTPNFIQAMTQSNVYPLFGLHLFINFSLEIPTQHQRF